MEEKEARSPPILKLYDTFSSYEELRKTVERYEKANRVQFWTRDAKKLHRASPSVYRIVKEHPELEYCSLRLACIHGGKPFQQKDVFKEPKRKSRGTWKQDCKAEIFIKLNDEKNKLQIQRLVEEHNHAIPSVEVFKQFPKLRRISGKRRIAQRFLVESKLKERLNNESGIKLENIVKANSLARSNNFKKLSKFLKEKYSCTVELQTDESARAYGFFFQDSQMHRHFQLFPEMLTIDGTYTLLNISCRIFVMHIENSLGSSNIVGVGVLTDDTKQSSDWLFQTFKNKNPRWEETTIILIDRQTCEDQVVSTHFPNAQSFICPAHASYAFKRDINRMKQMEVTSSEVEETLKFFNRLIEAEGEEEYAAILEDMEDTVPYVFMNYFHEKWDNLKSKWVRGFEARISNFVKISLEDPNSKFRSNICNAKTFSSFVEKLFLMLYLKRSEFLSEFTKTLKFLYKNPSKTEIKYQKILTPYAFEKIRRYINLADGDFSEIKFQYRTEDCDVICETDTEAFVMSEYSCGCNFFTLLKLPCQHLLIYRKIENLDLFLECLFSQRWTREYAQNLFVDNEEIVKKEEIEEKNDDEKFQEAEAVCTALATLCSDVGMGEFEDRMDVLQQLKRSWENKDKVVIRTVEFAKNEEDEITELMEVDEDEDI